MNKISKQDMIELFYLYLVEKKGATNEEITQYTNWDSNLAYDILHKYGVDTDPMGRSNYGVDCGRFKGGKYKGKVTRELIGDFFDSGYDNIIEYITDTLDNKENKRTDRLDTEEISRKDRDIDRRDRGIGRQSRENRNTPETYSNLSEALRDPKWVISIVVQLVAFVVLIAVIVGIYKNGFHSILEVANNMNFVKVVSFIITILITKPILKDKNTGFNLGGRIMILASIWLAVLYYISEY